MTQKNDGGPAFPQIEYRKFGDTERADAEGGLSVRDYFAAAALTTCHNQWAPKAQAIYAYLIADALIAERSKTDD